MSEPPSSYYPPRAGWNRYFYQMLHAAKRQLHIENLNLPRLGIEISAPGFLFCVLLPGFSFYNAGWKRIGKAIAFAWLAASCVFLLFLGYAAANIAFGLMMSMHVSSIIHFLNRIAPGMSVVRRLVFSLAILFVVAQLIYNGTLHWVQNHWFMPLQSGHKVYVINRMTSINSVHRGDFVAFHADRTGYGNVWIREGYLLDRVLAEPHDEVEFNADVVRVNGVASPRLPLMLAQGSLIMPEKTWLVWPSLRTVTRYNASEYDIGKSVLQMAQVRREQIVGTPFHHWFWRDQTK